MFRPIALALSLACIATIAKSHEFWIEPKDHTISEKTILEAELKVGQDFKGSSNPFLPPRFRRFDIAFGGTVEPVKGRVGDRPALRMRPPGDGLVVLIHETTDIRLAWETFEKFETFVVHKDAAWSLDAHVARGLPKKNVTEVYSRYAKSLIAVGSGAGEDVLAGMETEIVALENPYTGNTSDGFDLRVLYQGQPRANEQIEVFEKSPNGEVRIFTQKTDASGKATIPVRNGFRYMVDSVVVREPEPKLASAMDAQWETLWANLTFAIPAR